MSDTELDHGPRSHRGRVVNPYNGITVIEVTELWRVLAVYSRKTGKVRRFHAYHGGRWRFAGLM